MVRRHQFTLIELLVVVGIIAILAALLLPALGRARMTARQVECLNNEKNIAVAIFMYVNDYQGHMPLVLGGENGVGREDNWIFYDGYPVPDSGQFHPLKGTIGRYLKSPKLFHCPLDKSESVNSYAINSLLHVQKLDRVVNAVECPMLLEEASKTSKGRFKTTNDAYYSISANGWDVLATRHSDGSVIAFCDGHAEYTRMPSSEVADKCLRLSGDAE